MHTLTHAHTHTARTHTHTHTPFPLHTHTHTTQHTHTARAQTVPSNFHALNFIVEITSFENLSQVQVELKRHAVLQRETDAKDE
jgi:hypothetical protein